MDNLAISFPVKRSGIKRGNWERNYEVEVCKMEEDKTFSSKFSPFPFASLFIPSQPSAGFI